MLGIDWNHQLNTGRHALIVIAAAGSRSATISSSSSPACSPSRVPASRPRPSTARGRSALLHHHLSAPRAHHLLPAGRQHRLRDLRDLPMVTPRTAGGPAQATHPRLQGLEGRVHRPGPRVVGRAVGDPDGHRHRPHHRPVPLHRTPGQLLMVERSARSHAPAPRPADPRRGARRLPGVARARRLHWTSAAILAAPCRSARAHSLENYSPCSAPARKTVRRLRPDHDDQLLHHGPRIAVGKIVVSLLVGLRHRVLRFPLAAAFWSIFITLMLPVEVRIMPTYKVVADLGMLNSYCGPHPAADRVGHRHLPLPAVLPDHPGRTVEAARIDGAGPHAILLRTS